MRNATIHEALYMEEPLGFALHGMGGNSNLTLEMEALVCRLLIALLGAHAPAQHRSAVPTDGDNLE